jgi:hypothetical protein
MSLPVRFSSLKAQLSSAATIRGGGVEPMQKWEYLQVTVAERIYQDWHPLYNRDVWIDSRGRMGAIGKVQQEFRGVDRRGREQTGRVGRDTYDYSELLNELGEEGWELVITGGWELLFKRPKR